MRRYSAALAVAVTAGTVLVATSGPAQAYRDGSCDAGDFCIYNGLSWSTSQGWGDLPNAVSNWSSLESYLVNEDSSWRNKYSQPIRVYKSSGYGGGVEVCINSGVARTAGTLSTWDDDGQSNHNVSAC